ncbi:MAG: hypothetical protein ACRBEE_15700 [Arenicella sp.]
MNKLIKNVGKEWVWFADYAFPYSKWTIICEEGRICEVGMGISFRGRPRGFKEKFSKITTVTTIGLGAIKVRTVDGLGDCKVSVEQGNHGYFPIY